MKRIVVWLLRAYKWAISPLLLPACRFVPTCSEYAMEAVERHGVVRGGFMAAWRLLRCNPFSRGGLDPVAARTQLSVITCEHLGCEPLATSSRSAESDPHSIESRPRAEHRQLGTVSR